MDDLNNLAKIGFSRGLEILRQLVYNLPIDCQEPFLSVLNELDKNSTLLKSIHTKLNDAIGDTRLEILDLDFQLNATLNELAEERRKNGAD